MKHKNLLLIIFAIALSTLQSLAQSADEIRSNPAYLCGEGSGMTVSRADEAALSDLASQIAVTINTETTSSSYETTSGESSEYNTEFSNIISSYSGATLTNTDRLIIKNEPNAQVLRYIKKSEIDRIFESRKKLTLEQVRLGENALENMQIDNALKYYYWSFTLLKSLRYPAELYYTDKNQVEHQLLSWLPEQLDKIFKSIEFTPTKELDNSTIQFQILYNGNEVASLDYCYFDGAEWSNVHRSRNGLGLIELRPAVTLDMVQFRCEYMFENEMHINHEIEQVMKLSQPVIFNDAYIKPSTTTIASNNKEQYSISSNLSSNTNNSGLTQESSNDNNFSNNNTNTTYAPPASLELTMLDKANDLNVYNIGNKTTNINISKPTKSEYYTTVINKISFAIDNKNYESVRQYFTTEGYEIYEKLIKYGNAIVLDGNKYSCLGINDCVECRGMNMSFSFINNNSKFIEEVAFTFNNDKKIDNLTFCLDTKAKSDIVAMTHWSESSRYILLSFLENYKTAYALKRINYLESIFDDDALIITGRVVRPAQRTDTKLNYNTTYIDLTRQSKEQYIAGLSRVFSSNEYVNIKFADCDVQKLGVGGEIYGIQIKQDYFSTNYADAGYLFLMVDLNDPKLPVIHVRTWQEMEDEEFGIISASDF